MRPVVTVVGGLIWSAVLLTAVGVSSIAAEVVLIPVAVVASTSASRAVAGAAGEGRARRRRRSGPSSTLAVLAVAGSVVIPLAALDGPVAAVASLVVLVLLVLVAGAGSPRGRASTVVVVAGPALAAMALILARHQSASHALAVVAATLAFDAGAFMMGNARTPSGGPVGVVFGLASVAVVALFVAAVMNPPFSGARPWAVFAVVGLLAAAGVQLCERAVPHARVPALRRLDSLMLAAPAWIIALAVLPHP